jgi:uncharacterized membrane protein YfcA
VHPVDLWLIPLGLAVGAFGTLVGAGGGFILVPILLLHYPSKPADTITSMSLLVVCANASSGSVAYGLQKRIDYRSGWWFIAGTFPGAIAGAIVVGYVPRRTFDAIFATALCLIGGFLILRRASNAIRPPVTGRGVTHRQITDLHGDTFRYSFHLWKGILISVGVGFNI